jgi:hypothetical protein
MSEILASLRSSPRSRGLKRRGCSVSGARALVRPSAANGGLRDSEEGGRRSRLRVIGWDAHVSAKAWRRAIPLQTTVSAARVAGPTIPTIKWRPFALWLCRHQDRGRPASVKFSRIGSTLSGRFGASERMMGKRRQAGVANCVGQVQFCWIMRPTYFTQR